MLSDGAQSPDRRLLHRRVKLLQAENQSVHPPTGQHGLGQLRGVFGHSTEHKRCCFLIEPLQTKTDRVTYSFCRPGGGCPPCDSSQSMLSHQGKAINTLWLNTEKYIFLMFARQMLFQTEVCMFLWCELCLESIRPQRSPIASITLSGLSKKTKAWLLSGF